MLKNIIKELNGNDDWLAKELERESRVSAWDFDEARILRNEHAENCDVRAVADEHHQKHMGTYRPKPTAQDTLWMTLAIFFTVFLIIFNTMLEIHEYLAPILLFLCINPGIFIWLLVTKRMPTKRYYITVILLAILMELFSISSDPYLRFRFFRYFGRL